MLISPSCLYKPEIDSDIAVYHSEEQNHGLEKALDKDLIDQSRPALEEGKSVQIEIPVLNIIVP